MTISLSHIAWLETVSQEKGEPVAPPDLTACVRLLFETHPEWNQLSRADAFIEASEALLRRVLDGGEVARANALDLLAADACVTWAFEAAADQPQTIAALAERATKGIAAIAAEVL